MSKDNVRQGVLEQLHGVGDSGISAFAAVRTGLGDPMDAQKRILEPGGELQSLSGGTDRVSDDASAQVARPGLYPEAAVLLRNGQFLSSNTAWDHEIGDQTQGGHPTTLSDLLSREMSQKWAELTNRGAEVAWDEPLVVKGCRGEVSVTATKERHSSLVWLRAARDHLEETEVRDYLLSGQYARRLVENIACGLVVIDREFRVLYMNRWIRDQVGEQDPEAPPFCYAIFHHPPRSEPCPDCPTLKTLTDGGIHGLEVNPDSRKPDAWYRLTTSPLVGPDGEVLGVAELVVDISTRKRFERELKSSERLLSELAEYRRRILEQTCVGVATIDFGGNILSWNQGAQKMFGYSQAEAVGGNVKDLLVPEGEFMWSGPARTLGRTGLWEGSLPLKAKDGNCVWARTHVSVMRDDSGGPVAAIMVLTDVSTEEKLRQQFVAWDNRLNTIVEFAPFDVGAVDGEGVVTLWGATTEANTGIPRTAAVGSRLEDLLSKDPHCQRFLAEIEGVFSSGKMRRFEDHAPRSLGPRKGQESEEVTWLVPILGADGDVAECVWYMWDATEFRRLQRELLRAERMAALGTLAGGVAHECNNIMGSIQLYAQLALKRADLSSATQALSVVLEGVGRMKKIVQSLLQFSGDRPLRRGWTDVADVMESALVLFEQELEAKGISVRRDYGKVPKIFADPHRVGQVFVNLIINARDAMVPDGGTLRVCTRRSEDRVLISVADTGQGIPKDMLDRVFEPFFTTKGPISKSPVPGTGLGLSASHGIVQDHGGTVSVESEEGKGTTFTISLPIEPSPPHKDE